MALGAGTGVRNKSTRTHLKAIDEEVLGPELAPAFTSGLWTTSGTGITVDATGFHFVAASNIAHAQRATAGLEDNARYKVVVEITNFASANGGLQVLLYGATSNHLGQSITYTSNGVKTFYLDTVNTGTVFNTMRFRCSGTTGNNTFDVISVSVKKVL